MADLNVPQSECFTRGEAAIQHKGLWRNERTKYSRFGTRENYAASVRYIEKKGLVLFLASGHDHQLANKLQLDLERRYLKSSN